MSLPDNLYLNAISDRVIILQLEGISLVLVFQTSSRQQQKDNTLSSLLRCNLFVNNIRVDATSNFI